MSVGLSHHLMPPASFLPLLPSRFPLIFKILGKWHLSKNPLLTLRAWCQSLNPYSLRHPVWHLIICCHLWFKTSLRFASYCSQKVNAHGLSLASHRIPDPQAWFLMRLDQSLLTELFWDIVVNDHWLGEWPCQMGITDLESWSQHFSSSKTLSSDKKLGSQRG